jgi:8-oxo-dGTP diphosphatase
VGRARRGRPEGVRLSLFVLRHAWAGHRDGWHGPDHKRPLDERGEVQASQMPHVFDGFAVTRLLSSPYVRCVQTVRPLADARGIVIEESEELAEGASEDEWLPLLERLAFEDAIACVHGDITHALFGRAGKKGAAWEVDSALRALRILLPPS